MYKIEFANNYFQKKSDQELEIIRPFIEQLKNTGDIPYSEYCFFPHLNSVSLSRSVNLSNFQLVYTVSPKEKLIRVYGCDLDPRKQICRMMNKIEEQWNEDQEIYFDIPQADRPEKIIETVDLVNKGINDTFNIGKALKHEGKKDKDIARHGNYFAKACMEINLLERKREGKKFIYYLTETGEQLNQYKGWEKYSFLSEIMLNYYPVNAIFDEIYYGKNPLTLELTEEKIKMFSESNNNYQSYVYSPKTLRRRAKCMMRWVLWVANVQRIPVRCAEESGMQLFLPLS